MGLFDNYKLKKSIEMLLAVRNPESPELARIGEQLKQVGPPAIPKLLAILDTAGNPASIAVVLALFVDDETLPIFLTALGNASRRVHEAILAALRRADTYDPNRLLGLFSNPKVSSSELEELLGERRERLHPDVLLRAMTTTGRDKQTLLLQLIEHVATEATVPELVHRLRAEDWAIRYSFARILCRFNVTESRDALMKLLSDPHKKIRLLALEGLVSMSVQIEPLPICKLLGDSEREVRGRALGMLLRMVQDESEEIRRKAIEGLNAVDNPTIIKSLLSGLKGKEWWETARVADALGTHGGQKIVSTVLALLKDQDEFIRQCALEIILTIKEEAAFNAFIETLKDKETLEHTIKTFVAFGDKRALSLFIRMLDHDRDACLIGIRSLVIFKDPQSIHPLLVQLQNPDKEVRQEALRALAGLTNAEHAPDVLKAILAVRGTGDDETTELANQMATTMIKRFGASVMPRRETNEKTKPIQLDAVMVEEVEPLPATSSGISDESGMQRIHTPIDVMALEHGTVLANRYRVVRRVGEGGFSTVFLVDDTMVHEDVILKILNPQVALGENMIKRFIQELRYARKVTHENVIRIHDFIQLGQAYAISMEYFPSHTLADELDKGGALNVKRGLKIIWDVCRGIGAAHNVNIVHRDLKPLNILINDQDLVKVVDFGVAAVTSQMGTRLTRVGTLLGTPAYIAPEQVRSRTIDARTDIYSLGVVMYEVFTGRQPYVGDDMSVLFQHVEGNLVPPCEVNPNLAPGLGEIITKALAVDPDKRFQSMDELRRSLVEFSRQQKG
jgi:serine/threonine-protein kinase